VKGKGSRAERAPEQKGSRAERAPEGGRQASPGAFRKLPGPEQERILRACREEFASRGYALASTNAIVKRLGIPKGSLFYWFGTKDDLYLHLVGQATERFVAAIARRVQGWPAEILARLRIIAGASMDFLAGEPDDYRLFMAFTDGEAGHLLERFVRTGVPDGLRVWSDWFDGVDKRDYRVSDEEVRQLLMWVVAGIKVDVFTRLDRTGPPAALRVQMMERLDRVIPILAHAIYRHPAEKGYT
jgi:AcrR family transcriptional regulator